MSYVKIGPIMFLCVLHFMTCHPNSSWDISFGIKVVEWLTIILWHGQHTPNTCPNPCVIPITKLNRKHAPSKLQISTMQRQCHMTHSWSFATAWTGIKWSQQTHEYKINNCVRKIINYVIKTWRCKLVKVKSYRGVTMTPKVHFKKHLITELNSCPANRRQSKRLQC